MLIGDDELLRGELRQALESQGYRVLVGRSSVRAEEIIAVCPDLLLLDIVGDERGDGWQLVQELKSTARAAHMPIVICSADGAFVAQQDVRLRSQAAAVLSRPLNFEHLLPVLETALARHPARATPSLLAQPLRDEYYYLGGIPS
jgi:DNA-binding response OmpR family regulator